MALSAPVATLSRTIEQHAEGGFSNLAQQILRWRATRTTRRAGAALTDDQLADVGIDRSSVTGPVPVTEVARGYHVSATGWR